MRNDPGEMTALRPRSVGQKERVTGQPRSVIGHRAVGRPIPALTLVKGDAHRARERRKKKETGRDKQATQQANTTAVPADHDGNDSFTAHATRAGSWSLEGIITVAQWRNTQQLCILGEAVVDGVIGHRDACFKAGSNWV